MNEETCPLGWKLGSLASLWTPSLPRGLINSDLSAPPGAIFPGNIPVSHPKFMGLVCMPLKLSSRFLDSRVQQMGTRVGDLEDS